MSSSFSLYVQQSERLARFLKDFIGPYVHSRLCRVALLKAGLFDLATMLDTRSCAVQVDYFEFDL